MTNVLLFTILTVASAAVSTDPAWIALIGTIFGGTGLKIAERWLSRAKETEQNKAAANRDYRVEIRELQEREGGLQDELEEYRTKFYATQEEMYKMRRKLIEAGLLDEPPN